MIHLLPPCGSRTAASTHALVMVCAMWTPTCPGPRAARLTVLAVSDSWRDDRAWVGVQELGDEFWKSGVVVAVFDDVIDRVIKRGLLDWVNVALEQRVDDGGHQ